LTPSRKTLISIVGTTAIGKTSLSILLAQRLHTEIISCDSRQFFREMKIGTATPSEAELRAVPHHFIGNLSIAQDYSVGDFERDALRKISELFEKYDHLIMVGGSGLYEKAVNEGLNEFPDIPPDIKKNLIQEFEEKGIESLQERLKQVDFQYYKQTDIQNPVRLIRALEVYSATGKPYSSFRSNQLKKRNFLSIKIGLTAPRKVIYDRINHRVEQMMSQGLLEEVHSVFPYRDKNALQTVGYKELFEYLDGKISLDFAVEEIKKNTRRYAKRQLTWYRRDASVHWFDYQEIEKIEDFIDRRLNEVD
jgi:tRNA dimethylallyltransferase